MTDDEPTAGLGRIVGSNDLQRAVDSTSRTVARLDATISRLVPALERVAGLGTSAGRSWGGSSPVANGGGGGGGGGFLGGLSAFQSGRRGGFINGATTLAGSTMTPGVGNGGNPTFSGGGKHRAEGPVSVNPFGSTGGSHRAATGNGYAKAFYAAGVGADIAHQISKGWGPSKDQVKTDSELALNLGQMAMPMRNGGWASVYDRNSTAMNGTDDYGARYEALRATGSAWGSSNFNSFMGGVRMSSLANPSLSNSQAASNQAAFGTPMGYMNLRKVGIESVGPGGRRKTTSQITNEILGQVDPHQSVRTVDQARTFVYDPFSNFNQTLGNWVANGVITGDQVTDIQENAFMILKARSKGMSFDQLQKNVSNWDSKDQKTRFGARNALRKAGIGRGLMQGHKNEDASERESTNLKLDGFETGVKLSTNALEAFHDEINAITKKIPLLNFALGLKGGGGINGTLGAVGAGMSLMGIAGSAMGTVVGSVGSIASSAGSLVGGLLGGGGLDGGLAAGNTVGWSGALLRPAHDGHHGPGSQEAWRDSIAKHYQDERNTPVKDPNTHGGGHGGGGHHAGHGGGGGGSTYSSTGFGGVKPWVARAGWELKKKFNIGVVGGVGSRSNASDHPSGHALDFMRPGLSNGWALARYARANWKRLGVHYIIWQQQIWNIQRDGEGWRKMEDRGDPTSNHFDHVHISFQYTDPDPNASRQGSGAHTGSGGSGGGGYAGGGSGDTSSSAGSDAGSGSEGGYGGGSAGGSGGVLGISEASIVAAALGGGGGGGGTSYSRTSGDSSGDTGSGGSGGSGTYDHTAYDASKPGNYGKGVEQWRGTVISAMQKLGIKPTRANVDRTLMQMKTESSGNPTIVNKTDSNWQAGHPSVGLMQVIEGTFNAYAGPYRKQGPFSYGVSTNPMANIYASLNYAVHRYGSLANAFKGHGYSNGAWELKEDETARVHKGEMIIPKPAADQIRQVLLQNSGVAAGKGGGARLVFEANSIQIHIDGGGGTSTDQGKAIGKAFVNALMEDNRIKSLQNG